jgi:hypothetical protein
VGVNDEGAGSGANSSRGGSQMILRLALFAAENSLSTVPAHVMIAALQQHTGTMLAAPLARPALVLIA